MVIGGGGLWNFFITYLLELYCSLGGKGVIFLLIWKRNQHEQIYFHAFIKIQCNNPFPKQRNQPPPLSPPKKLSPLSTERTKHEPVTWYLHITHWTQQTHTHKNPTRHLFFNKFYISFLFWYQMVLCVMAYWDTCINSIFHFYSDIKWCYVLWHIEIHVFIVHNHKYSVFPTLIWVLTDCEWYRLLMYQCTL